MSFVRPVLFSGWLLDILSTDFSDEKNFEDMLLLKSEGDIQFTLMFGAHSAAKDIVIPFIADLTIDVEQWYGIPNFVATVLNKTIEEFFCNCFL